MTAHNDQSNGVFSSPVIDRVARQAEVMLDQGASHVWLFRCPECKGIVLSPLWDGVCVCAHCGTENISAAAVDGDRPSEQILADIAELITEWAGVPE